MVWFEAVSILGIYEVMLGLWGQFWVTRLGLKYTLSDLKLTPDDPKIDSQRPNVNFQSTKSDPKIDSLRTKIDFQGSKLNRSVPKSTLSVISTPKG